MASIVNRRPARALRPEAPRGPGGSFDSLTWVGYASLVAAFGFLVFGLRPILDLGDTRNWDLGTVFGLVVRSLRNASVVALPAALEWGVPGARRVTPWLLRGTVLLALEAVLGVVLQSGRDWMFESQLGSDAFSYESPVGVALILAGWAVAIVGMAGAWSLSDGLADAGGRPRRRVLIGVVAIGTAAVLATYVPYLAQMPADTTIDLTSVILWANVVGLVLDLVDNALWLMVAARLIAGLVAGRRPRRAWLLGGIAAAGMLFLRLLAPVFSVWAVQELGLVLNYVFSTVSVASWLLLPLAFAAGLGRGRVRRRPRPRVMRLFVLKPTS